MLFYSVPLVLFFGVFKAGDGLQAEELMAAVFAPLASLWWFPTVYILLILVAPYLFDGLRALTSRRLGELCMLLIVLYGVLPVVPYSTIGGFVSSLTGQTVVIACVTCWFKWHYRGGADAQGFGAARSFVRCCVRLLLCGSKGRAPFERFRFQRVRIGGD